MRLRGVNLDRCEDVSGQQLICEAILPVVRKEWPEKRLR